MTAFIIFGSALVLEGLLIVVGLLRIETAVKELTERTGRR